MPAEELWSVYNSLQPAFDLSNGLTERRALKLDEALVYVRDTRLCELLLSLLRRLPWSEVHSDAESRQGLALLPGLLGTLGTFFQATARVRSSQQAAAHAELSKWCRSQARAPLPCCADSSCDIKAASVCWLLCLCLPSTDTSLARRYESMRVYEVLTDTAVSLVEAARAAQPSSLEMATAVGCTIKCFQKVRTQAHDIARGPNPALFNSCFTLLHI